MVVTAVVLSGGTWQQRKRDRSTAGTLRSLQLQPRTVKRYLEAKNSFFSWLSQNREPMPVSIPAADEILGEYIEDCWAAGDPRGKLGDALSGLQHFIPSLRKGLNDAWRLFGTWSKTEIPSRARPLLPEQYLAMAGYALAEGDLAMAAGVLVCFNGILRPIEAMLTAGQCSFDFQRSIVHLDLGYTKGGKRSGIAEHVVVDELEAVVLLSRLLHRRPAGTQLFPRGTAGFRKSFKRLVLVIGADPSKYKPYSLRRGGATLHFQVLGSLSKTCVRGRWRHQPTARIYIQDGMAMLQRQGLSRKEKQLISKCQNLLRRFP